MSTASLGYLISISKNSTITKKQSPPLACDKDIHHVCHQYIDGNSIFTQIEGF